MTLRQKLRWWKAPLWLAAVATGAKSFADNPILGSRRLNRAGLHVRRLRAAHGLAWKRRARLAAKVPAQWREQFDRNGFVVLPDFLPKETFESIRAALLDREWPAREHRQGDTITRRVAIGPDLLRQVPELDRLFRTRGWRSLLAYVASTASEPLYYVQTILGGVLDGPRDPQLHLHSDTFHPSLKAWLFLTDVAADGRPLTYVPGSHRLTEQRLEWEQRRSESVLDDGDPLSRRGSLRIEAEELKGLGLPAPIQFAVQANTLVAVDTFGFHARGDSDHPTLRVEIWAFCRRTPFLPWAGFDPLSVRPLAIRRVEWLGRILDRMDALGLAKQHWLAVGTRRPGDQ